MSTYLDRIRARSRRQIATRAKKVRSLGRPAHALEPLALDGDHVSAIQNALADHSLEPAPGPEGTPEYPAFMSPERIEERIEECHRILEAADACVVCEGTHARTKHLHPLEPVEVKPSQQVGDVDVDIDIEAHTESGDTVPAPYTRAEVGRVEFAKSSNVRSAILDVDGNLTVTFADGKEYRYGNFTLELLEEWRKADSAGSWFHHQVRRKPERHPVLKAD